MITSSPTLQPGTAPARQRDLHPVLSAALSSLDVDLEAELTQYQLAQCDALVRQDSSAASSSAALALASAEALVPAENKNPAENKSPADKSQSASTSIVVLDNPFSAALLEGLNTTALRRSVSPGAAGPQTYLASSEELLRSLEEGDAEDYSSPQPRWQWPRFFAQRGVMPPAATPLSVGLMLLVGLSSLMAVTLLLNARVRVAEQDPGEDVARQDAAAEQAGDRPLSSLSPDLTVGEFTRLNLSRLVTLSPRPNRAKTKPVTPELSLDQLPPEQSPLEQSPLEQSLPGQFTSPFTANTPPPSGRPSGASAPEVLPARPPAAAPQRPAAPAALPASLPISAASPESVLPAAPAPARDRPRGTSKTQPSAAVAPGPPAQPSAPAPPTSASPASQPAAPAAPAPAPQAEPNAATVPPALPQPARPAGSAPVSAPAPASAPTPATAPPAPTLRRSASPQLPAPTPAAPSTPPASLAPPSPIPETPVPASSAPAAPASAAPSPAPASPAPASTASSRYHHVVTPYTGDRSLEDAREAVSGAYLRNAPTGAQVQLGVFESEAAAQQLVNQLSEQGIDATVTPE